MVDFIFKTKVKKYKALFITIDNIKRESLVSEWVIENRLNCSIPDYLMIDIKNNGYIKDKNEIMYPLSNILSIKWILVEEIVVEDNFDNRQVFANDLEVKEYIYEQKEKTI